jgi:transcription-repair coupling factor (superfamily II helicase)
MEILEKRIHKIIARILDVADFRRIASDALRGDSEVVVSGLSGSGRALFIAGLWQSLRRPLIVVTPQDRGVEALATDLSYFHSELNATGSARVCPFPAWETDPYAGLTPHADVQQSRAKALWKLRNKQADIVVASIRSLSTRLIAPAQFDTYGLHIASGDDLSQDLLMEHLANAGYLRQEPVGAPGEFSIRGGIVDVFSPLMRNPVRIEFFGDSVDSIREFDLDDQRSRGPVQHIDILPMQEIVISREMLRAWSGRAREQWNDEGFEKDLNEKLVFADNGEFFTGAPYLMPIVQPLESTLFDYAESAVLVLEEPELLQDASEKFFAALEQRYEQTIDAGGIALPPQDIFLSPEMFRSRAGMHKRVNLEELGASGSSFFVRGQPAEKFHGRIKEMAASVGQAHLEGREVVLLGSTVGMAERLRDILHEYGVPFRCEFGEPPLKAVEDASVPIIGIGKISMQVSRSMLRPTSLTNRNTCRSNIAAARRSHRSFPIFRILNLATMWFMWTTGSAHITVLPWYTKKNAWCFSTKEGIACMFRSSVSTSFRNIRLQKVLNRRSTNSAAQRGLPERPEPNVPFAIWRWNC